MLDAGLGVGALAVMAADTANINLAGLSQTGVVYI
jgi:hypothetical protein